MLENAQEDDKQCSVQDTQRNSPTSITKDKRRNFKISWMDF